MFLKRFVVTLAWTAIATAVFGQESSPIAITPEIRVVKEQRELVLKFHVPERHHLYAERLAVSIAGQSVKPALPDPVMQLDKYSGKMVGVYTQDFVATVPLPSAAGNLEFSVDLQGCSDAECYFPETRRWSIGADQTVVSLDISSPAPATAEPASLTEGFRITQRASGYLGKKAFLSFLDQGAGASGPAERNSFAGMGALATVLLILLGGFGVEFDAVCASDDSHQPGDFGSRREWR